MGRGARFLVVIAALTSTTYLLQFDDSLQPARAAAPAPRVDVAPVQVAQADSSSGREYFIRRHEVVPLGTSTLRLPILMYHYIRPYPSYRADPMGWRLSIPPEIFQQQMDWLWTNGYHAVNFAQVRGYFAGNTPLPSRPIVITLDDGYQDLYTVAFPILRAHGFTAVAYIVTGFLREPGYVSAAQVLEMDRAGIQIASHTVHHADLAKSSYGSVAYETLQSKLWLEQLLGHPVLDFAYPSGQYNATAVRAVQQAGYDTAVTTQTSVMHSMGDRYLWGRVRVGGGESMEEFIESLGASMPSVTITNVNVKAGG